MTRRRARGAGELIRPDEALILVVGDASKVGQLRAVNIGPLGRRRLQPAARPSAVRVDADG